MQSKAQGKLMGLLVLVVALSVGAVYAYKATLPREGKVRGTIASLDPALRTAVLDVIHPKTGVMFQVSGTVREDCKVELEGAAAGLDQLRVGDAVEVQGLIYRMTGSLIATEVRAKRRTSSSSSRPAAAPPTTTPVGGV